MKIKIGIVDDHRIFLDGIALLLSEKEDMEVVAKMTDYGEFFQRLSDIEMDVLLLDVEMPRICGIDMMEKLLRKNPYLRVLMLTMYKDPSIVKKAIQTGAHGYVLKNVGTEELLTAIRTIAQGKKYFSPDVMQEVMEALHPSQTYSSLSSRELEIIQLIADQQTTKEIAKILHLSRYTIETHRKNILLKLGLKNTAGLIKYSLQKGLIQ
ncbi:MAG: response regulator transcription factor [Bacteroidota bacterium]